MGYHRAGFDVVGVDIKRQPHYPFRFYRHDAVTFVRKWGNRFAAVHASPPCQAYSKLNAYNHREYPDLMGPTRVSLVALGLPYVIENIPQAPMVDSITLCGAMFGLRVYRHRGFESSLPLVAPEHPRHVARCVRNSYIPKPDQFMTITGGKHSRAWREFAADVMGVPWTQTIREVCEAIPPAYTEHVGRQLITALGVHDAAA